VVVLVTCLAMSVGGWRYTDKLTEDIARSRFEGRVSEVSMAIEDRMAAYELALRGGLALFSSVGEVSRAQWRDYVGNLNLLQNYPGIQGMGYAVVVPPAERQKHTEAIRREGFPDYTMSPPGEREVYTAIVYLEPFDARNQRAFGFDMFSDPTRRAAMERSRDTGRTSISARVTLVQETTEGVQAGFLMYLPCYKRSAPVFTDSDRRAALRGYVFSPFRMNNFMMGIVGKTISDLGLEIHDGGQKTEQNLMFRSQSQAADAASGRRPLFTSTRELTLSGRTWTLTVRSLPGFEATLDHTVPLLVLVGGSSIGLLLFFIALSLLNTQRRALALADVMTAELRESEERTRLILESTGEPIYGIDTSGLCTFCNPACLRTLGYTRPEDLLGKNMHVLIHHTHADGSAFDVQDCRIFQAFKLGKGTHADDEVLWRADGSSFPVEYSSYPQLQDGEIVGAVVVFQDITERRRSAALLAAERQRLAYILEGTNVGTWEWNVQTGETVFNERWAQIIGYTLEELSPASIKTWEALAHPEDLKRSTKLLEQHFSGELDYYDSECRMKRKNGDWVWVHDRGKVATWTADGKPLVMSGTHQDISARMQAEQALMESKSWLAAVLETAVDPIFTIGQQGYIRTANSAACKTFGYTLEELVGQNVKLLMPEPYRSNHDGYLERYLRTNEPHILGKGGREVPGQRKDGTIIPLDLSVSEISSSKERTFTGILRDISEQVRSRDALTAANAGLVERQSRLDADMEAAAEIQRSLLPKEGTCSLGLEADFRFMPSATIGGDIFNVVCLDASHTGLYMIDVSGHGVPAALVSVTLAQEMSPSGELLMDKLLDQPRSPEGVLRLLDSAFPLERFDKFFSMFYMLYEMETGTLTYCNAGHPPPMLLRAGGGLECLEEGGTLVGLGLGDTYAQGKAEVGDGDMLLVYTDGVSELESPDGEQFSTERLEELFRQTRGRSPEQVLQMLTGKLQAHADGRPPDDDISLVCVRFSRA
jgi:PAS domain S-box-containing protein